MSFQIQGGSGTNAFSLKGAGGGAGLGGFHTPMGLIFNFLGHTFPKVNEAVVQRETRGNKKWTNVALADIENRKNRQVCVCVCVCVWGGGDNFTCGCGVGVFINVFHR